MFNNRVTSPTCPFCEVVSSQVVAANPAALAFRDGFPVAEGHTLVIPRRHVSSIFDAPIAELAELWALVAQVRDSLAHELRPDGFSIGVNDGVAAGQTVGHGHVHVIPQASSLNLVHGA
jgi:diadenosine tetraphosphate (Ap4A) HIT family hydrolase